jgi:8-oxo-dGTP pyrophosphatase MutT (NUDIX family)
MRIPETVGWRDGNEIVQMKKGMEYAAVAIVINNDRIVIEKRNSTKDDPWSGQFSLPGGHYSKVDRILRETAVRETLEETGLNLNKNSTYMGHFGPFSPGNKPNMEVYAYAFEMERPTPLVSSRESEYIFWVALSDLVQTNEAITPAYRIREGLIWGLTARIIERFMVFCKLNTK